MWLTAVLRDQQRSWSELVAQVAMLSVCVVWVVLQFVGWRCLCSGGWGSWWGDAHLQHEKRDARQSRKPRYVYFRISYNLTRHIGFTRSNVLLKILLKKKMNVCMVHWSFSLRNLSIILDIVEKNSFFFNFVLLSFPVNKCWGIVFRC